MALDVWDLVQTSEVELPFGGEGLLLRAELFRSRADARLYRGRLFRRESWVSSLEEADEGDEEDRAVVLVEWTEWFPGEDVRYVADTAAEAMGELLSGLEARLKGGKLGP
jgi:hypothetical protein